ncbi:MAG: 50S ribosomal protein L22 [Thermoplasmata archaeon]|nr:50S ribosomal protein L22 [Thermoplasmata archaeon]
MAGYTAPIDPEKNARALGKELNISPKKALEVCRAIRGKMVPDAKDYLEDVIDMKRPVPYYRHNRQTGRKKGIPVTGGYPQKTAKGILKVLESAEANAVDQEMDPDEMRIKIIAAHRGRVLQHFRPRAHGRATPFFRQLTNIEIILEVMED